jgi:digeranylgeranylglycerophospholipid reductase
MYDAIIIGAGPAGCRTAELLARGGKKVLVIEEHAKIGEPIQCTGLISAKLLDIHPDLPKNIIQNKIKTARFFAPNGANFELSVKKPALVVDRAKLDQWLASKARKAGAKFKLNTNFVSYNMEKNSIKVKTNKGSFETKYLVGADGPLSKVREQMELDVRYHQQIFAQIDLRYQQTFFQKTRIVKRPPEAQLNFGGEYFNWCVPFSKTKARIGGPSKEQKFKGTSGGVVRYGLLKTAQQGRVFLVGDAALQVKPFSCGGVIYGQIAAQCLSEAILEEKDYDELWKQKLEKPIKRGLHLCLFYKLPNFLKNFAFWIAIKTKLTKTLEKLDMDFY